MKGKFSWQEGYGAFSYAQSQLENVYKYILNQEEHHKKKNFKQEYPDFLHHFQINFDEKNLFDWVIIVFLLKKILVHFFHFPQRNYLYTRF